MRRAGDEEEDFLIIIQVDVFLPLCPERHVLCLLGLQKNEDKLKQGSLSACICFTDVVI